MKKIKLIFKNDQDYHDLNFILLESHISLRWFKKLQHLYRLPLSDLHSELLLRPNSDRYDIHSLHEEFCKAAKIKFVILDYNRQENLNLLHRLYEQNHDLLINVNADILNKFHRSIHDMEHMKEKNKYDCLSFGWGVLEGPIEKKTKMHQHYPDVLKKGNLYLKWGELGKLPSQYYRHGEPNDQERFNSLAKPNQTLRARFSLQLSENKFKFTNEFNAWFKDYKSSWLDHHGIDDWRPIDEVGGVHVAEPLQDIDLEGVISKYPNFEKIELY